MQSIDHYIEQQIEINQSKNLLYAQVEQVMEFDPDFVAALEELLISAPWNSTEGVPAEIVSLAVRALLKKLYSINQYLQVSPGQIKALENIYQQTWQIMLRTRNVPATLREHHYPALSRWLADLYPQDFLKYLRYSPIIGRVMCEEYSAEFQIELFDIKASHLKQPIIDIGCGSHANLVRYLRSQGLDACGLDRFLDPPEVYLVQADWFEYFFEPGRWGTIISNIAFTNHLNYTYQHDSAQLERYLLKMREIIEALVPGGRFYYAPSLPFVEERLAPNRFRVTLKRVTEDVSISVITRVGD